MTNYLSNTLRGMALTGIVASLSGCDTDGKLELAVRQSDGPVKIQLIQDVRFGSLDRYILEVVNMDGKTLAYMSSVGEPEVARIKLSPDKTYHLNMRGVRIQPRR